MPKEGFVHVSHKSDSSKVSPLSEAQVAVSSANAYDHRQCSSSNGTKDKKPKTMSRMKELLRWSASAKPEKGAKLRKKVDGRRLSISESPKISLRWDVEKCSTISSVISGVSMASSSRNDESANKLQVSLNSTVMHGLNHCSSGRENWITTDSELLDFSDTGMPTVGSTFDKVSNAVSFFLVCLIWRSPGLICSGIRNPSMEMSNQICRGRVLLLNKICKPLSSDRLLAGKMKTAV
ncbi:hypothetical protein V6N12_014204 [Hibiscus sabdariffa]|uniref:Uncharacterized protein n=1 Tax=Hibiscus sabdariffa TaxID=183260 RepID=A0ABR2DJG1_9ROSI